MIFQVIFNILKAETEKRSRQKIVKIKKNRQKRNRKNKGITVNKDMFIVHYEKP